MVLKYMDLPDDQKQAMQQALIELEKVFTVIKARVGLDGDDFANDQITFMIKLKPIK